MNSNNYYSVAVSNCLSEFESLFTKNKFISKKVFDEYFRNETAARRLLDNKKSC